MKHTLHVVILSAVLALLPACSKSELNGSESSVKEEERVSVVFSLNEECASTKATGDEVASLDLLVFRASSGQIESYNRVLGSNVSASVVKGMELEYRLVANITEGVLSGVKSLTEFSEVMCDLKDENTEHCLMVGRGREVFLSPKSMTVEMTRLVSRVLLQKITPTYYEAGTFTVRRIYLINAVGRLFFTPSLSVEHWYNRTAYEADNTVSVLSAGDLSLVNSTPTLSVDASLYTYPNPVTEDVFSTVEPSFTPRKTRLVVEADHLGETEFFPITLPSVVSNTTYLIKELVITGPGTSHPDTPISRDAVKLTIDIKPWGYNDIDAPLS